LLIGECLAGSEKRDDARFSRFVGHQKGSTVACFNRPGGGNASGAWLRFDKGVLATGQARAICEYKALI